MNSRTFSRSLISPLARQVMTRLRDFRMAKFRRLLAGAAAQQERWILERVARCRDTTFGKDHGFAEIRTLEDFRRRVPFVRYEGQQPYNDAVAAGRNEALIPADDRLQRFTITTGSSGVPKLNPVTRTWLKQYKLVWELWGLQMFGDHP